MSCGSNKYPECATCLNRENDPFECEDCEDGDLYIDEDAGGEGSAMSVIEVYRLVGEAA